MKVLISLLTCAAALAAQTAAPKAPAKKAPAKTGAPAVAKPNPKLMNPKLLTAKAPDLYRVRFTTTKGDFVIEVNRDWAPLGADRFYNLVRNGFFTNGSFFRVVPNFIVQFGVSPSSEVTMAWQVAPIKDDPHKESNKAGTITFAAGGPNTRTTQVFINLQDNSALDSMGFSPFGTVTEGMEIVKTLYSGYGGMFETEGRGPKQELLMTQGKPYLDKNFPSLDSIKSATIIFPLAHPPVTKKSPSKGGR